MAFVLQGKIALIALTHFPGWAGQYGTAGRKNP